MCLLLDKHNLSSKVKTQITNFDDHLCLSQSEAKFAMSWPIRNWVINEGLQFSELVIWKMNPISVNMYLHIFIYCCLLF